MVSARSWQVRERKASQRDAYTGDSVTLPESRPAPCPGRVALARARNRRARWSASCWLRSRPAGRRVLAPRNRRARLLFRLIPCFSPVGDRLDDGAQRLARGRQVIAVLSCGGQARRDRRARSRREHAARRSRRPANGGCGAGQQHRRGCLWPHPGRRSRPAHPRRCSHSTHGAEFVQVPRAAPPPWMSR